MLCAPVMVMMTITMWLKARTRVSLYVLEVTGRPYEGCFPSHVNSGPVSVLYHYHGVNNDYEENEVLHSLSQSSNGAPRDRPFVALV